jgi:hypothetical protein
MKALCFLLTLVATGLAQSPAPADPTDNARKAKDVIQKTIQAMGGQAFLSFVDYKQEGRGFGFYHGSSVGVGAPFVRYYAYPDKERFEFFKEGDWVIIHNGDKGYETTFRGTREEDPKDNAEYRRRRLYMLEVVLRGWAQDPKTAFFYDGTTIAETRQVHKITLMNTNNQSVTLYINSNTYLPVKKSYTWRDPEYKEMAEESELFDNWRIVQGIATPHLYTRTRNGEMNSQRFIKTVTYNTGRGEAFYAPPPLNYDKTKK